jgi:SAM-dependent methyltransferase
MAPLARLKTIFFSLAHPWLFMAYSLYYLPGTVLRLIRQGDFATLLSWPRLQSAWFSAFWAWAGPRVRQNAEPRVIPLLDGRVQGGRQVQSPAHPPVSGIVVEVGPGSGMWVDLFRRRDGGAGPDESVERVYGIEPNVGVHTELRKRIQDSGSEGVYKIVPVGIESLSDSSKWAGKIEKESVDCIVSILCLCSIPEPEKNIKELYGYLKKGGRWYVYEHVKVDRFPGMRLYQGKSALYELALCQPPEKRTRKFGRMSKNLTYYSYHKFDLAPYYRGMPT